jgi:hypothetical protein
MYMVKLNYEQLRNEIQSLNRHKKLYRLLRDELSKIGHWKMKARGNPIKAFHSRGKSKNE